MNRIEQEPKRVEALKRRVEQYLGSAPPPWKPGEVLIDDMDLRQLRALGYAIE